MISRLARGLTLCCGMAAVLVAAPSESHALCGLFDCLFGGCRTTYFAPSACSPCATTAFSPCGTSACGTGSCGTSSCGSSCSPCNTSVCNYMPQTCFRPTCVNVPVTTFRCVSSCDPCTGCPTTAMQPVTTFVRQVRYTPFTTFRPVCSTVATPVVAAPAVFAPAALPATSFSPVAPSGGCCNSASTTLPSTFAVPAAQTVIPSTPVIQTTPMAIPATPAPTLNTAPVITPLPRTDLRAIPDSHFNGSSGGSNYSYDPDSRTTRAIAPRPIDEDKPLVVPAVYTAPANKSLDDSGWRAARR